MGGAWRAIARICIAQTHHPLTVLDNFALDPREALRRGYRFDSFRERFQARFKVLKTQLAVPQDEVEDWLALPARERRPWFAQADLRSSIVRIAVPTLLIAGAAGVWLFYVQHQFEEAYWER